MEPPSEWVPPQNSNDIFLLALRTLNVDTEFRADEVQYYCRNQDWGWQLGIKSDTLFHVGDGQWQALQTQTVAKGFRRFVHNVTLTQKHS